MKILIFLFVIKIFFHYENHFNNKDLFNRVNIRCKLIEPKEKEFVYFIIDYLRLISVIEDIKKPY